MQERHAELLKTALCLITPLQAIPQESLPTPRVSDHSWAIKENEQYLIRKKMQNSAEIGEGVTC